MTNLGPAQIPVSIPPLANSSSSTSPTPAPASQILSHAPIQSSTSSSATSTTAPPLPQATSQLPPIVSVITPALQDLSPTTSSPPRRHPSRSSSPKRPRRPPPLLIPSRPPTSLPTCFYPHSDPHAPPSKQNDQRISDLSNISSENVGVWRHDSRSAAATRKGRRRRINEDRVFATPHLGIFGVCDGHGADSFPLPHPPEPHLVPAHRVAELLPPILAQGLSFENAFLNVDQQICALFPPRSFIGTTVTVVQVHRGHNIRVAHVGDSRAMLISAKGVPHYLTEDHSPTRADESTRIEKAGGHVLRGRVNGVLAVSRAVGDRALKAVVPALPDVLDRELLSNDQLLVVASDGLWDMVSDVEVTKLLKSLPLVPGTCAVPDNLEAAAETLVDEAISRGSRDDTSVILIDLRHL